MRIGVVLCARYASQRVRGKVLEKINGKPVLSHLLDRLTKIKGMDVILAVPTAERDHFQEFLLPYDIEIIYGWDDDPLHRMYYAAKRYNLDHIVRVTHDKILVDPDCIYEVFNKYMAKGLDYAYSSDLPAGCGFEIISLKALEAAAQSYQGVEHISYAIKAVTDNKADIPLHSPPRSQDRFLIDFPEDLKFMRTLFACAGDNISMQEAIYYCNQNPWLKSINRQPKFTIYTCAYNAEAYVQETLFRTIQQTVFTDCEYLLIDDHSTDGTTRIMAETASNFDNVHFIRNDKNMGLAASSNLALSRARGQYIVRIDADDYFTRLDSIESMENEIRDRKLDAVYPGYYDGAVGKVGKPETHHHAAGTLFKTRALNHIKFTDKLRNYEGYDLYLRAKSHLAIGYINAPLFFYRHTPNSMSRSNLEERAQVKKEIEQTHGC